MPNQPKTPVSGFRLDEETKQRLRRVAENQGVTMTEAIRRATSAMENLHASMRKVMPEDAAPRLTPDEYASLSGRFSGRLLDEVVSAVESILDGRGITRPSP